MLSTTALLEPIPETQQDTLELLLQDREWIQAQFAAIMNASGFGDRLIVGTIPCPPYSDRVRWASDPNRAVVAASWLRMASSGSRVRSPPR